MNHDRRRMFAALGLCLSAALPAAAQTQADVEGSRDYQGLSRVPGFYISVYEESKVGAFDFRVADDGYKRVVGHSYSITYALKDAARSPGASDVGRSFADAIAARRGTALVESIGSISGSATANWTADGLPIWAQVQVNNSGATYTLNIVEEQAMLQNVELTAMELGQKLDERGAVAVHGIEFEAGTSVIKPESEAVLAQIAELLGSNEELKVEIQAYTDNVGDKTANVMLSKSRAIAVKEYLVTIHQATPAQMTTAGLGDAKPVGDNATEEGRTLNRRIELVKKS